MRDGHSIFRLEAPSNDGTVRLLSSLQLARDGSPTSRVTVTRTGTFYDPRYGEFDITKPMLLQMVKNFRDGVYGQKVFIDVAHNPSAGAAGEVVSLDVEGNRLRAGVEWTEYGIEAIRKRGFRYLSAEFHENWTDNEERQQHGALLMGAGLTIRPVIKRLEPVQLSEDFDPDHPVLLHPALVKQLSQEAKTTMKEFLKRLRKTLHEQGLAEKVIKQLCDAFEASAKNLGDDKDSLKALCESFEQTGKALHEQIGDKTVTLSIPEPKKPAQGERDGDGASAKTLSEEDVKKILAEQKAEEEAAAKKLQESLEDKKKAFRRILEESDEGKALSEETRKEAIEAAEDLITPEMTDAQVTKLAQYQLSQASKIEAARQLSQVGWAPAGSPQITVDESNAVKSLQQEICQHLRGTPEHASGRLRLLDEEKLHPFAAKVLQEFDRLNARRLHQERKVLAGEVNIDNSDLPVSHVRTVIREALSDLRILELVTTMTDFGATGTTQIPYEERDVSQVVNDGIVYEGQGIPFAGVSQKMDLAYIVAMKVAMKVSNEVIHFSRASTVNWDAWARSAESNARFLRELIVRRICNELQRSADSYLKANVSGESIASQLDGATSTIKTANFPIIRPHQQKDLQGNNVGAAESPISIDLNGTPAVEYDGTGTQSAGTYFRVTNYNLGYVQLVDETGTPATPNLATASIDYSYATNIVKFDLDNGTTALEKHLNGLLRSIGERKATLDQERFVEPDFLLMSATLNDTVTNAEQFTPLNRRDGTDTTPMGDLEGVKGVPAWKTNAPSVDLGEERILMGPRGTMTYKIAKPFMTGQPFEAVDANGKPTGQKVAYGEEYSAIKVPTPIRERFTSVIAYSFSNR